MILREQRNFGFERHTGYSFKTPINAKIRIDGLAGVHLLKAFACSGEITGVCLSPGYGGCYSLAVLPAILYPLFLNWNTYADHPNQHRGPETRFYHCG